MTIGPIQDNESLNLLVQVIDLATGEPKSLNGVTIEAASKSAGGTVINADYAEIYDQPTYGQIQVFWPAWLFYGRAGTHEVQIKITQGPLVETVYRASLEVQCGPHTPDVVTPVLGDIPPDRFDFTDTGRWMGIMTHEVSAPIGDVDHFTFQIDPRSDLSGAYFYSVSISPAGNRLEADTTKFNSPMIHSNWKAGRFYGYPGHHDVSVSAQLGNEAGVDPNIDLEVFCSIFEPSVPTDGRLFFLAAQETGADVARINMSRGLLAYMDAYETGSDTAAITMTVDVGFVLDATETGADVAAINMDLENRFTLTGQETGADIANINMSGALLAYLAAQETGADTAAINMVLGDPRLEYTLAGQETGADIAQINMGTGTTFFLAAIETGADTADFTATVDISFDLDATETGADTADINMSRTLSFDLDATETGADTAAINMTLADVELSFDLAATETGADTADITMLHRRFADLDATETGADTAAIVMETGSVDLDPNSIFGADLIAWYDAEDNSLMQDGVGGAISDGDMVETIANKSTGVGAGSHNIRTYRAGAQSTSFTWHASDGGYLRLDDDWNAYMEDDGPNAGDWHGETEAWIFANITCDDFHGVFFSMSDSPRYAAGYYEFNSRNSFGAQDGFPACDYYLNNVHKVLPNPTGVMSKEDLRGYNGWHMNNEVEQGRNIPKTIGVRIPDITVTGTPTFRIFNQYVPSANFQVMFTNIKDIIIVRGTPSLQQLADWQTYTEGRRAPIWEATAVNVNVLWVESQYDPADTQAAAPISDPVSALNDVYFGTAGPDTMIADVAEPPSYAARMMVSSSDNPDVYNALTWDGSRYVGNWPGIQAALLAVRGQEDTLSYYYEYEETGGPE